MEIRRLDAIEAVSEFKRACVAQSTAPLDGMWLCGFVPIASHFGFFQRGQLAGYCCVNDEGFLLHFYLSHDFQIDSSELLKSIVDGNARPAGQINGAFTSTAEPSFLSLCLDQFRSFDVKALMYQRTQKPNHRPPVDIAISLLPMTELPQAVEFAIANVGAPAEWLRGYYANLIDRQELYGVWKAERLIAAGESRGFDEYQTEYADLGVVVDQSERGQGLATTVLRTLDDINERRGLKSICSTESTNIGAQKAIERAGFFASNRIIEFHP